MPHVQTEYKERMSPTPVRHIRKDAQLETAPFEALCGELSATVVGEPTDPQTCRKCVWRWEYIEYHWDSDLDSENRFTERVLEGLERARRRGRAMPWHGHQH